MENKLKNNRFMISILTGITIIALLFIGIIGASNASAKEEENDVRIEVVKSEFTDLMDKYNDGNYMLDEIQYKKLPKDIRDKIDSLINKSNERGAEAGQTGQVYEGYFGGYRKMAPAIWGKVDGEDIGAVYCIEPLKDYPAVGGISYTRTATGKNNTNAQGAYYVIEKGNEIGANPIEIQVAVWVLYNLNGDLGATLPYSPSMGTAIPVSAIMQNDKAAQMINYANDKKNKDGFEGWTWHTSADYQDVIQQGTPLPKDQPVTLNKLSEAPQYTNGNSAYDMSGAKYGLYTDSNATNLAKTTNGKEAILTVDSNGKSNTLKMEPDTYYAKEMVKSTNSIGLDISYAKAGYLVSDEIKRVVVGDEPVTFTMEEPILYDPVSLRLLGKTIEEMDKQGQPNADITDFSGAQFKISWYKNFYNSIEDAKKSGEAGASAVWETDSKGELRFDQKPVSGSWDIKDNGFNAIPLGTVTVEEVKAIPGTNVASNKELGEVIHFKYDESKLFLSDREVIKPWVNQGEETYTDFPNESMKGSVEVVKADNEYNESLPQGDAHLEGTEYTIINKSKESVRTIEEDGSYKDTPVGEVVRVITTDVKGFASTPAKYLPYGTYEISETKAPTGYNLNPWTKTFSVREDGQVFKYNSEGEGWNKDDVLRYGVVIGKADRENQQYLALGEATLEGAVFEITNESKEKVMVDGNAYQPGEVVGTLVTKAEEQEDGSTKIVARSTENWLPYGSYSIKETKSPHCFDGNKEYHCYLLDQEALDWSRTFSVGHDGSDGKFGASVDVFTLEPNTFADLTGIDKAAKNQVSREDFSFKKKAIEHNGSNNDRLRDVAFEIKSKTTGESHIIVVDENGMWGSSWNAHSKKTNSNDPDSPISNGSIKVNENGEYEVVDASKLDSENGVWFTGHDPKITKWIDGTTYEVNGVQIKVNDKLRAFPYDTYELNEIRSQANEGYQLVNATITLHKYGNDLGDGMDIDYGTLNDTGITPPELKTILFENVEGQEIGNKTITPDKCAILTDKVSYSNLEKGKEYTLYGELWKVKNGQPLEKVTSSATKFIAEDVNGEIRITFDCVDTTQLEPGVGLVAFEYLYPGDTPIDPCIPETPDPEKPTEPTEPCEPEKPTVPPTGEHEDPEDPDQTVEVKKPEIGTKFFLVENGDVNTNNKPTENNTKPGVEENNNEESVTEPEKPTVEGEDEESTTEENTTPESGENEKPETGEGTASEENNQHPEVTPEENNQQSEKTPDISVKDGKQEFTPSKNTTLRDKIMYKGLQPGTTYYIVGEIHKFTNGKEVGVIANASETFTPTTSDGETFITFNNVNTLNLTINDKLVAYEYIYNKEVKPGEPTPPAIGEHADPDAKEQTVKPIKEPTNEVVVSLGETVNIAIVIAILGTGTTAVVLFRKLNKN